MKPITSKQEFLMFMTCNYIKESGLTPKTARLECWAEIYESYLTENIEKRSWKHYISAFARFLLAGFVISIPAMLIISIAFTLSGYESLIVAHAALIVLQLTYVSSAIDLITKFIARGLVRKKL
ncbi:hypothetical protein [Aliivibrio finisterrensis]|uniref:hypothetical protein n=1 Tax=Aliivibrio finisterrensis TaxID=511998 RepID=UPI0010209802|nr:hypothetical protein [Aliivibrio finisterrensis]RYU50016.1 hypothetical protein ERW56_15685 [Aliivibrio finisterrensis]RYU55717.1 hypothetical protein ERW50_15740 [Aliivibrio finisterrensis]RYU80908.1 hypothetical protein ERW55_15555 [Aliivibrio finisterrensis]